jgi:membrane protein YdbS with pleckstrin-like domain
MSTETEIWKGTSSQLKNFWWFVACLLVLPIPWAIAHWLKVKCRTYTLTTERLIIESGVFSKTQDTLELYRVRDLQITEPFFLRLFGLQNIHLLATDLTTGNLMLDYIPSSLNLRDQFREHIEACRGRKGVREVGLDVEPGIDTGGTPQS